MPKPSVNPNAIRALEQMKYEIAEELGLTSPLGKNDNTIIQSGQNIFFAGHVGGHMTRKLVEIGQKQLLEQHMQNKF